MIFATTHKQIHNVEFQHDELLIFETDFTP